MNKPTPQQMDLIPADNALPMPTGTDTMSMIERLARDPSFDADKLEKLLAMKERQDKEEARKAYFTALAQFQSLAPKIMKVRDGLKQRDTDDGKPGRVISRYAPLDYMIDILQPSMMTCGLSHRFQNLVRDGSKVCRCYLMHTLGHEEYSEFPVIAVTGKATNAAQAEAVGLSYAMRYCYKAVLGIVEQNDDKDGVPDAPITMEHAAVLTELREVLAEQSALKAEGFDAWILKRGYGSVDDLPDNAFNDVHKALKKATGQ